MFQLILILTNRLSMSQKMLSSCSKLAGIIFLIFKTISMVTKIITYIIQQLFQSAYQILFRILQLMNNHFIVISVLICILLLIKINKIMFWITLISCKLIILRAKCEICTKAKCTLVIQQCLHSFHPQCVQSLESNSSEMFKGVCPCCKKKGIISFSAKNIFTQIYKKYTAEIACIILLAFITSLVEVYQIYFQNQIHNQINS